LVCSIGRTPLWGECHGGGEAVEGVPSSCTLLAPSFTKCRYQTFFLFFSNFVLGKEKEEGKETMKPRKKKKKP
jgi:hypothetical protein